MSATQAAYQVEKAVGHDSNSVTQQDVSDYERTGSRDETMKALVWEGKGKVEIGTNCSGTKRITVPTD